MPNGDVLSFAGPQYRICSTSATAQSKVISALTNIDSISILPLGYTITVRMDNAQLYNGIPQLAVNNMTLPIYFANGIPAGYKAWGAGDVLTLMYGQSEVEVDGGAVLVAEAWFIIGGASVYKDVATLSETKQYLGIA